MIHILSEFIIQELHEFININNILNTTNLFKEYKKKYFYWDLNEYYSFKYYSDVDFYTLINSKIMNVNKQLHIDLTNGDITDEGLKKNYIGNVHTLNLSWCDKITDESVKQMVSVHELNLWECRNITDDVVKHLGKIHTLNLMGCNKITDESVKHLGNCHKLDLNRCDKITDESVKFLGNCHTLHLGNCINVTNDGVKYLGDVTVLHLNGINITDEGLRFLGNTHIIDLDCENITDDGLRFLGNDILFLYNCNKITKEGIKHLTNVNVLHLYGLDKKIIITKEWCMEHLPKVYFFVVNGIRVYPLRGY